MSEIVIRWELDEGIVWALGLASEGCDGGQHLTGRVEDGGVIEAEGKRRWKGIQLRRDAVVPQYRGQLMLQSGVRMFHLFCEPGKGKTVDEEDRRESRPT